jgi:hypothetical protein
MVCDSVVEYRPFFEQASQGGGMQKSLGDHFFERGAQLNKLAFLQQVVPCQSGELTDYGSISL